MKAGTFVRHFIEADAGASFTGGCGKLMIRIIRQNGLKNIVLILRLKKSKVRWLLLNGCRNLQPHSPLPLSELWRASFARSVALRLFLLAQKKGSSTFYDRNRQKNIKI